MVMLRSLLLFVLIVASLFFEKACSKIKIMIESVPPKTKTRNRKIILEKVKKYMNSVVKTLVALPKYKFHSSSTMEVAMLHERRIQHS